MIHAIKISPKYFEGVRSGAKRFELRKNDRDYQVGDYLALNEWDGSAYTGRAELVKVTYALNPNAMMTCQDGFVILSIVPCGSCDNQRGVGKDEVRA